jgi:hypothetical protein
MMPDQRSVTDQLKTLLELANKNGLYDAADWLKQRMPKADEEPVPEPDDDGDYMDRKYTGAVRLKGER